LKNQNTGVELMKNDFKKQVSVLGFYGHSADKTKASQPVYDA